MRSLLALPLIVALAALVPMAEAQTKVTLVFNGKEEGTSTFFEVVGYTGKNPKVTVAPNTTLNVTFNNAGQAPHNWVLQTADKATNLAKIPASAPVGFLTAGQNGTVEFAAPAAGTYRYVCTIHDPPMSGEFVVGTATTGNNPGGGKTGDGAKTPGFEVLAAVAALALVAVLLARRR